MSEKGRISSLSPFFPTFVDIELFYSLSSSVYFTCYRGMVTAVIIEEVMTIKGFESDMGGVGGGRGSDGTNENKIFTYSVLKNKTKCKWYVNM